MGDSDRTPSSSDGNAVDQTRRTFVKTVAYVTPAILTLTATPALASPGSVKDRTKDWGWQDSDGQWRPGSPTLSGR